jgi:hypothetical protein
MGHAGAGGARLKEAEKHKAIECPRGWPAMNLMSDASFQSKGEVRIPHH